MPTKLKPSEKIVDRQTKKVSVKHYYIKSYPQEELFKELNKDNTKPKHKQKNRNELSRRGIKIIRVPKEID